MNFKTILKVIIVLFAFLFLPVSGQAQSTGTIVKENITEDTTWTLANSPYIIPSGRSKWSPNIVTITQDVQLTIEPGVVIQSGTYSGISIKGILDANGSENEQIIFTSSEDAAPKQWGGIHFDGGGGHLNHVVIRFAGRELVYFPEFGISISPIRRSIQLKIFNSTIESSGQIPMRLSPNALHQLELHNNRVAVNDNNTPGGIDITGTMNFDGTLSAQKLGFFYLDGDYTVPSGISLTIGPGAEIRVASGKEFRVQGHVDIFGTLENPVVFTSLKDSAPGQWGRFIVDSGTANIQNSIFRYGGREPHYDLANIAIQSVARDGEVVIRNTKIEGSSSHGLTLRSGKIIIDCVEVSQNIKSGIIILDGDYRPEISLSALRISENTKGIVNDHSNQIDARNVWWGDASGPSGLGSGSGDTVQGNILYEPWQTSAPSGCSTDDPVDTPSPTLMPSPTPTEAVTPSPTPSPPRSPTPTSTPLPTPQNTRPPDTRPLVLIYAVLDNNLGTGSGLETLLANVHDGARANLGIDVRLMIDEPGNNNSYIYDFTNGSLQSEQPWHEEDTASLHVLYDFLEESIELYPDSSSLALSLIGHGGGWGANALPAQPIGWSEQPGEPSDGGTVQETFGGVLWDDNTGNGEGSRSLSTRAMARALKWFQDNYSRTIDLLYLDACSMASAEVIYELGSSVKYVLASQNTAWASFAYDQMLPTVNSDMDGAQIGEAWLKKEAEALLAGQYPFTLSVIDVDALTAIGTEVDTFAQALQDILSTEREAISQLLLQTDRYESNYNGVIDANDTYVDLWGLVEKVKDNFVGTPVGDYAEKLLTKKEKIVLHNKSENGVSWVHQNSEGFKWDGPSGLTLYFPFNTDEAPKRRHYNSSSLRWARDTGWHNVIDTYWVSANAAQNEELPTCTSTIDENCNGLLAQLLPLQPKVYLPLIEK